MSTQIQQLDSLEAADDGELLTLFLRSRESAYLEELARRHYALVYIVASRQLRSRHDIEDAVQTTFLVLTRSAKSVRKRNSLASWLYGVVIRTAQRIRQQSRSDANRFEEFPADDVTSSAESPLSILAKQMQLEALDEELHSIGDSYREVLVEHYLLGRSASEIAERFNLSQSTIEGRLRRGRKQLRTRMLSRGYSFASAIALVALPNVTAEAAAAQAVDVHSLMDPSIQTQSTDFDSRVDVLVSQEMKMATALASKVSGGFVATAGVATLLGMLSVSSFGYQAGEGDTPETVVSSSQSAAGTEQVATVVSDAGVAAEAVFVQTTTAAEGKRPTWARTSSANLRQILDQEVTPEYNDVPLEIVLRNLADDLKVPIWLDRSKLAEHAIAPDEPVTLNLPPLSVRQLLKYMLKPLKLGYRLEGPVLVVAPQEVIDFQPSLRAYDLSILSESPQIITDLGKVVEQNIRMIEPANWSDGMWNVQQVEHMLMIGTTEIVHGEIELMLSDLAEQLGRLPKASGQSSTARMDPSQLSDKALVDEFRRRRERALRKKIPNADPFSNTSNNDPFGSGGADASNDDPFSNSGGAGDPFGGSSRKASRERATESNPFGESSERAQQASDDPFGN